MSNKSKGANAERELLKLFTEQGWRAARVAGSSSNENTFCDLIAGKMGRKGYVVEAKSSKKKNIYITKEQIEEFVKFSEMIGLSAVIAARFNREGWLFLKPEQLEDSGKYWTISLKNAKSKGMKFGQFFEKTVDEIFSTSY